MKYMQQVAAGIDTIPLALALARQPDLWNVNTQRQDFAHSAHRHVSDIWVRYNDLANLTKDYDNYTKEHDSVWLPAYANLPQVRAIVFGLMARCEAVRLGGVLITKIPAGKSVLPHTDAGWHPEYYNTKIFVPIITNPNCITRVEDEIVIMAPGEAWYFNNTVEHEIVNNGDTDRITLIISMRCDK